MKKYISSVKLKIVQAMIIGCCFTVFSTGAAFAETGSKDEQPTEIQTTKSGDVLLQKQTEIDKYVFETHRDELEKKGITVTHTGPQSEYVEIGITPYNDTNAEYLYEIFGREIVKVVEGQQAVTLGTAVASNNSPVVTSASSSNADIAKSNSSNPFSLVYTLAGVVLLGVVIFITRKLRVAKR